MDRIAESTVWELEVSLYVQAIEHGVRPVRADLIGAFPREGDPLCWAAYSPHTFTFQNPPSREDFWQLVRQTPWMSHYQEEYDDLIASNDWPMIDFCLKAAHVYLRDTAGRQVGELRVRRQTVYVNKAYNTAPILCSDIDAVCGRVRESGVTSPAADAVRSAEHKLKERLANLDRYPNEADVRAEIRRYLKEIGVAPRSRKQRQLQAV